MYILYQSYPPTPKEKGEKDTPIGLIDFVTLHCARFC